jgi:hypothetical protein
MTANSCISSALIFLCTARETADQRLRRNSLKRVCPFPG